jgi:hypothetical protein
VFLFYVFAISKEQIGTTDFKLKRMLQAKSVGSRQAPILVPEVSPKLNVVRASEDIQLVGSNDFRRRSCELAKKVDNTYNQLLNIQPSRNGPPEVIIQDLQPEMRPQERANQSDRRKQRLLDLLLTGQSPPLQENKRFPVSSDDIVNYSAIVELAHSAQHKKLVALISFLFF